MGLYMLQAAFTTESWANLARAPQDRAQVVRDGLERLNCKLVDFYFTFGQYDTVTIYEAPDETAAAAFTISLAASGGFKTLETTVLVKSERAMEAMRKAGGTPYQLKM